MLNENIGIFLSLLATLVLIGINGTFVAAELAIVRVRRTRLEELATQGSTAAARALLLVDNVSDYLATTQVGITAASLGVGWIGENAFMHLLDILIPFHPLPGILTHLIAAAVGFIIITIMHVILGELIPKYIAIDNAEKIVLTLARPLQVIHFTFRPLLHFFTAVSRWLLRRMGHRPHVQPPISENELKLLLEDSHGEGVIAEGEIGIIIRALTFADKKATDIMIPAERVDYLSLALDFEQNLEIAQLHRHARLPLCAAGLDTAIGVVSMKDAWPTLLVEKSNAAFEKVSKDLLKLPMNLSQDTILRLFEKRHTQIGIVRDLADQHTLGVITLEDVLESLIGDIRD